MKKFLNIIVIIVGVIIALVVVFVLFMIWASKQPAVSEGYYKTVASDKPLEQKYTDKGTYDVSYVEYDVDSEKIGQFEIWYPTEMENSDATYPLVVMANGTGVTASRYEAVFDHLASWGFIVIGNEDESSWDGASSSISLDFMFDCNNNTSSIFYGKIDTANIGIAGHSQGGVGAINAVANQENGNYYTALYAASVTHTVLAEALSWSYDTSKIQIPCFMTAGTLQSDAGNDKDAGIAPLWSLKANYEAIPDEVMKIYARRVGAEHGDMLAKADGYMTAWFMYNLKNDEEAGRVFAGEDAEILYNVNWQDIMKNR